jgi:hypothetical protein
MVTKPTGGPKGRPTGTLKTFSNDEDRYIIGMVNGLRLVGFQTPREHLIAFAVHFHQGTHKIHSAPLKVSNRLGLTEQVREALSAGYVLATLEGEPALIESAIDRIKKKMDRIASRDEPDLRKWMYYSSLGWALIVRGMPIGVVSNCWGQIGEVEYLNRILFPLILQYFGPSVERPL